MIPNVEANVLYIRQCFETEVGSNEFSVGHTPKHHYKAVLGVLAVSSRNFVRFMVEYLFHSRYLNGHNRDINPARQRI
jgi:hypothetical protein